MGGLVLSIKADRPDRAKIRSVFTFYVFAMLFVFCSYLHGQDALDQEAIASHLMMYVAPTYPSIAVAAQVQGNVVLKVEIAPDGLVRSVKPVSGSPMLIQTAADAVKKWRYRPFQQGNSTTAVTGKVLVSFTIDSEPRVHTPHDSTATGSYSTIVAVGPPPLDLDQPDAAIVQRFQPLWDSCSRGVLAHTNDAKTADTCKNAAAIADEFAADRRYIERRRVYVYAAIAYANIQDFQSALPYAEKGVQMVKLGHDDESGAQAAYSTRGKVRALSGDMAGGDEDLTKSENFARNLKDSFLLKQDLQFHAQLLEHWNRPEAGKTKADEAAQLH
jgi:TonB family protein